jgi:hypothetical protein
MSFASSRFALDELMARGTAAFTVVHTKSILKPTALPFSISIIRNGAAAIMNAAKHSLGGFDNPVVAVFVRVAQRLAGLAKEIHGVNVTDAGNDVDP